MQKGEGANGCLGGHEVGKGVDRDKKEKRDRSRVVTISPYGQHVKTPAQSPFSSSGVRHASVFD